MLKSKKNFKIGVIGLGYVGLPLTLELSKKFDVKGFDIDSKRINQLSNGNDSNREFKRKDILRSKTILTNKDKDLIDRNIFIVTVPTPISKNKKPNLKPLINATTLIANYIKKNSLIIYESTVFPGCTENFCVPILEKISKLKYKKDFDCGYSPERINVGDKKHTLKNIKKIVSASSPQALKTIKLIYNSCIKAGVFVAESIKVAEAAKVIENSQRDLNIAFVNELSIIFRKLNLNTESVLEAASSKWNFLKFEPGLVGGHCIGVDPYYLTYISKKNNYNPKIILSGRNVNDRMGFYIANRFDRIFKRKIKYKKKKKILILGITFKENCTDVRNSKVVDIFFKLRKLGYLVDIYDPIAEKLQLKKLYKLKLTYNLKPKSYDGLILAVKHKIFNKNFERKIKKILKKENVIYFVKKHLKKISSDEKL